MATLVNNFKHVSGQSFMSIATAKIQHAFSVYINSFSKILFPAEGQNASKVKAYTVAMMK